MRGFETMSSSYSTGQRIELNDGRAATIRFVGNTSFQTGDWIGVELEEATGKNDGSVKGERYFQCTAGYGMFVRPAGVRQVLEDNTPKARSGFNGAPAKSRPELANGVKRQSTSGGARANGFPAADSPTPGSRDAIRGLRSPTKQPSSNGTSSTSTSRTNTPPVGKTQVGNAVVSRSRTSLQPPASTSGRRPIGTPAPGQAPVSRTGRPSLAHAAPTGSGSLVQHGVAGRLRAAAGSSARRLGLSPASEDTVSEVDSEQPSTVSSAASDVSSEAIAADTNGEHRDAEDETIRPSFAPPSIPAEPQISPTSSNPRRPASPAAASIHSQRTIRSTTASNRQIEELEAKVRLLERKRIEDRGVKKALEQAEKEREKYRATIEKLQTKYRPQQQQIASLQTALSEAETRATGLETSQAEFDGALEMAALDREMAEEAAEGLQTELDALRARNEEVQLELDILKEENADLTKEMSPEERESAGWVQLQHSNDRLRNALLALRDRALDEKEELKEQIASLVEQTKDLDSLRTRHEDVREKLLRSEADTSDLKQQLEVALQADEMIEELTERNGRLEGTIDDMRAAIEDLENLKELNDELEINHVEAEKQLQEEIEFKDSLLVDRERTAKLQQEALDGKDDTIRQFRSLVGDLQADMADMKASKQITESEAKELEDKSRAMLDLNLKLQNTASKTQVKAIDLELRKLDAQEASEHLDIVRLFLPEAYHAERDSVLALLRFKRINFKAHLVHSFVKEKIAAFNPRSMDEDVFAACDVLDKLLWVASMADRYVNAVRSCIGDEFAKFESALYELEPVERTLNIHIDALRKDEIKPAPMAEELQRSIQVMSHLASLLLKDDLATHADSLIMRSMVLQSQLENAATALQLSRNLIECYVSNTSEDDDEDAEGSASDLAIILNRADAMITHTRSTKVDVGKILRSLTELQARSLTFQLPDNSSFDSAEGIAAGVFKYARYAGAALQRVFGEEGRNEPFTPSEIFDTLSKESNAIFSLQAPEAGPFTALKERLLTLHGKVLELTAFTNDLDNTVEFERAPAPWIAVSNELKQTKITSLDTEAELGRTLEALRGKDGILKEKNIELEEQSVRIEMLEARMKDASKRSARIAELEKALHDADDAEKQARRDMQLAREERDRDVAKAREEIGRLSEARKKGLASDGLADGAMGAGAMMKMARQDHKIASLSGAVRYLKEENSHLQIPLSDSPLSAQATLNWLHEPLYKEKTAKQQRLETLRQDGKDVLQHLLALATASRSIDLSKMPENKLAWRPVRETGRWQVEKAREDWEGWKAWRRSVIHASSGVVPKRTPLAVGET